MDVEYLAIIVTFTITMSLNRLMKFTLSAAKNNYFNEIKIMFQAYY